MRAVCSGTRGRGCCGWSDMVRPPEITAPTPLSTFRLTYSPTVSGSKWDSLAPKKLPEGTPLLPGSVANSQRLPLAEDAERICAFGQSLETGPDPARSAT